MTRSPLLRWLTCAVCAVVLLMWLKRPEDISSKSRFDDMLHFRLPVEKTKSVGHDPAQPLEGEHTGRPYLFCYCVRPLADTASLVTCNEAILMFMQSYKLLHGSIERHFHFGNSLFCQTLPLFNSFSRSIIAFHLPYSSSKIVCFHRSATLPMPSSNELR